MTTEETERMAETASTQQPDPRAETTASVEPALAADEAVSTEPVPAVEDADSAELPPTAEQQPQPLPPLEEPAHALERLSALPLADAVADLAALALERGDDAVAVLATVAHKANLPLANKAMETLASLRSQAATDALGVIGNERSDAPRSKEARRLLHRLSMAGLKPAPVAPPPAREPEPDRVYACMASPIGELGLRSVAIVRQNRFSTLRLGVFVMNEDQGVIEAYGADPCSLSMWKRFLADANAGDAKLVPVELAFCQQQIETAAARNERSKTPLPERYYVFASLAMGPAEARPRPAELDPAMLQANPDFLAKSADLFHLPECRSWLFDVDDVRQHALKFIAEERRQQRIDEQRQAETQIVDLNRIQREGALLGVAMNALFDGARRSMYQARLEYTADLLWRSDRLEQAQWAMAAALALAPESALPVEQHPFLREVVLQSIDLAVQEELERPASGAPTPELEVGGKAQPDYVDDQGFIRRKSGLILPR